VDEQLSELFCRLLTVIITAICSVTPTHSLT